MKDFKIYLLAILISMLALNSAQASRVPRKAVAAEDVYTASEPGQVTMEGFLGDRIEVNRIGRLRRHITEDMLLDNFRQRRRSAPWVGEHVGKWIHAATLALENYPNDKLLAEKLERIANGLMDCQMEDGYLGTYIKQDQWGDYIKPNPTSGWDVWVHKYVMIGLLSYYRSTGDQRALETCQRMGDLLIETFGDEDGKKNIAENGTHAGMASASVLEPMSLLYEYTGKEKYRQFCDYIVRKADEGPKLLTNIEEKRTVQAVGNKKGYEMMSCYVGLVENWRASGYRRGLKAAELARESISSENVFITGAPDAHEHFDEPHELNTNDECTETCAQVTWFQLNWQLLQATGKPRYAAMIHKQIYNHLLAAQHPDGVSWCYFTPMEGSRNTRSGFTGRFHCCGSSGPRAIALIPTFAYMTGKDRLAINLYENSTFKANISGTDVVVRQQTNYPWDGTVSIDLKVDRPAEFDLQLLMPDFVKPGTIQINGVKQNIELKAGKYATIGRKWSANTEILLQLDMPVVAHERDGRHALSRGPIILALERVKNQTATVQQVVPDLSALDKAYGIWPHDKIKGVAHRRFWALEQHIIQVKGKKIDTDDKDSSGDLILVYKPYCEAGTFGQAISVWLPMMPETKSDK